MTFAVRISLFFASLALLVCPAPAYAQYEAKAGGAGSASYYQQVLGGKAARATVGPDGNVHYSVPIGPLAYQYSSQGGWALTGASRISRSTRRGVPGYGVGDTFELDGEELVYVGGSDPREYRTKRETWQRIYFYKPDQPTTSYWIVQHPDGSRSLFGNATGSVANVLAQGGKFPGKAWQWPVARQESRANYDYVEYDYRLDNGTAYIAGVRTGKSKQGSAALPAYNKTTVVYENRYYPRVSYRSACRVGDGLRPVTVFLWIAAPGQADVLLGALDIGYTQGETGDDLASTLTFYGQNGVNAEYLPTIKLSYGKPTRSFGPKQVWHTSEGENTAIRSSHIRGTISDLMDMNADGLPDRVIKETAQPLMYTTSPGALSVWYNTGSGFQAQPTVSNGMDVSSKALHGVRVTTVESINTTTDFLDMNRDGLPDRLYKETNGDLKIYFNQGNTKFGSTTTWTTPGDTGPVHGYSPNTSLDHFGTSWDFLDLNGDGLPDRLYRNGPDSRFWLNTGAGFTDTTWGAWPGAFVRYSEIYYQGSLLDDGTHWDLLDLNGDGLPDFVRKRLNESPLVALNNGYGFEPAEASYWKQNIGPEPLRNEEAGRNHNADLIDINGDGLPDRVRSGDGVLLVYYNTGSSFKPAVSWTSPGAFSGVRWAETFHSGDPLDPESVQDSIHHVNSEIIDMDGDGLADRIEKRAGHADFNVFINQAGPIDRLVGIDNGLGGVKQFGYQSIDKQQNPKVQQTGFVVKSEADSDGVGDTLNSRFEFAGGVYVPAEREFRGFGQVKRTESNGVTTVTKYNTGAFDKGTVASTEVTNFAGFRFSRTADQYSEVSSVNGNSNIHFVRLDSHDTYDYDSSGASRQTRVSLQYDAFGNTTRATNWGEVLIGPSGSMTDIGFDKSETISDYSNDTTLWRLNLKTREQTGGYRSDQSWTAQQDDRFEYTANGDLLNSKRWNGSQAITLANYAYDAYGNRTAIRDAANNLTSISYDAASHALPELLQNPAGHQLKTKYDKYLRRVSKTDENNVTWQYGYDGFGRLTKVIGPGDSDAFPREQTTFSLSSFPPGIASFARLESQKSGTLARYAYYDGLGRKIQEKSQADSGQWRTVDYFHQVEEGFGEIEQTTVPYFTSTPSFTERTSGSPTTYQETYIDGTNGKSTYIIRPDGFSERVLQLKWVTSYYDTKGALTTEELDGQGRLAKRVDPNGAVTSYRYDTGTGDLTWVLEPSGKTTTFEYSPLGFRAKTSDADRGQRSFTFDNRGLPLTATSPAGTAQLTYDQLGRVTQTTYPGTGNYDTYVYDLGTYGKGRLASHSSYRKSALSSKLEKTYDAEGHVTLEKRTIDGLQRSIGYEYDALGRPRRITTQPTASDADQTAISYGSGGLASAVRRSDGITYVDSVRYRADLSLGGLRSGNGVASTWSYYDNGEDGNVDSAPSYQLKSYTIGANGSVAASNYDYDSEGNIVARSQGDETLEDQTFSYDSMNQVTGLSSSWGYSLAYSYDKLGNILSKGGKAYRYASARPHAATSDGTFDYTYDASGNVSQKSNQYNGYQYQYDWNGHLTGVVDTVEGHNLLSVAYDAEGKSIKKTSSSGAVTYYFSPYYEETWEGGVRSEVRKFYYLNGMRVARRDAEGLFFLHQDHVGTVVATSNQAGEAVYVSGFDPFGATELESYRGAGATTHYKFQGREYDDSTGLYDFGARFYDPNLGKFLSADSSIPDGGGSLGLNRYAFEFNNPLRYTDPSGHEPHPTVMPDVVIKADAPQIPDRAQRITFINPDFKMPKAHPPILLTPPPDQKPAAHSPSKAPPTSAKGADLIRVYMRSYAPWPTFGGVFGVAPAQGDNRGPSTSLAATSRMSQRLDFSSDGKLLGDTAWSDSSHTLGLGGKAHPRHNALPGSVPGGSKVAANLAASDPVLLYMHAAPDIDLHLNLTLTTTDSTVSLKGNVKGDAFPNMELFVVIGQSSPVMLDTFSTRGGRSFFTGPGQMLPGNHYDLMSTFDTTLHR